MTDQLPEPLVPVSVDLRGLEYMPLLGAKLFASDFNLHASDAEFRRALTLWWAAWNQQPAASLPNSERAQAKLAGFEDEKSPTWRKVRGRVLHGFVLCADGRLYHPVLAQQALIAWERRAEERAERENSNERKRRERAERSRMFEELRAVNVVPPFNIGMKELRELVTTHVTRTSPGQVTEAVTVTDTAKTGRDGTGRDLIQGTGTTTAERGGGRDSEIPGQQPTAAGAICRALRQAGIGDTNPGHPSLQVLLEAGATEAEFLGAVAEARDKGKPFAYVLATVEGQRKRAAETAAAVHRGPMPAANDRKSRQLTTAALMTGAVRAAPQPQPETIDVDARIVPPRALG